MSQLNEVTQRLREAILTGAFVPGERLGEVAVAGMLGVSRTPARLAMAALEQEGLLVRAPHRGVSVREFTLDEVTDAILVRGQLEGMAARLAAERGLGEADIEAIESVLREAEEMLEAPDLSIKDRTRWIELNQSFHRHLVTASGNTALADTINQVSRIPLASPSAIVFNRFDRGLGVTQIGAAHDDHRRVFLAIRRREGTRAEAIMREHAQKSADNKRQNFADIKARHPSALPGVALVR